MKFLKKRDYYLQTLNERREIQTNERLEKLILENQAGSGIMGNEIKWGDCLLGRLLNNIIRKSQIGANLVRIKPVVSRLRSAMEELLIGSGFNDLEGRDKALFNLALVSEYLDVLKISIQNYGTPDATDEFDTLEEIKGLVKDTVSKLEGTTATPYLGTGFENKNEIIRQLKKLEKHLNTLKEPEEKKDDQDADQDTDDQTTDSDDTRAKSTLVNQVTQKAGLLYAKNFLHVISLYLLAEGSNAKKGQEMIQKEIVALEPQIATTTDPVKKKQLQDKLDELKSKVKVSDVKESNMLFEATQLNISSSLKNLIQVFSKQLGKEEAKKSLTTLKTTLQSEKVNPQIVKIYEQIRNEEGLKTKIDENIDLVLNDTKGISSVIRGLYSVVKSKGGNVDDPNISPEVKNELKLFFDTMKPCLALDLYMIEEQPKEETPEETKESLVLRYNGFVRMVKEELTSGNQGGIVGSTASNIASRSSNVDKEQTLKEFSDDLRDWWDNNLDIDQYIFSKQDAEKAKEQLDKKLAAAKDSIVIDGMDPVLEIVKCFNRAYKIHTTQVISSGRTGGQVANKIFMEYTCFGSGTPQNAGESGGPYRNNKLFDLWESNVLDVLKEKKYQKIFSPDTRLKVGNEFIEKAGSNLRKFMTDMLNGDDFYGKGGDSKGGLQSKFLDKYFGYKDGDDPKNTHFEGISERENNENNTPGSVEVIEVDGGNPIKVENEDLKGTFFSMIYTVQGTGGTPDKSYFFIQDYKDGIFYVSFCKTIFHMKKMLESSGRTHKFSNKDFQITEENEPSDGPYLIRCTTIKADLINKGGGVNMAGDMTCGYISHEFEEVKSRRPKDCNTGGSYKTNEKEVWKVKMVNHIVDSATKERVTVTRMDKVDSVIKTEGGFTDVIRVPGIANVRLTRN